MTAGARRWVSEARRWVVKVGSALLTDDGRGLDERVIDGLVAEVAALRRAHCEVLLVSSGAVAAGLLRLDRRRRPERRTPSRSGSTVRTCW